jgi:hypothetical protein
MKCISSDEDARAVCQFCGRAVCREHLQKELFVSGYTAKAGFWNPRSNAVRVADAVWCGVCHPEYKGTS